MKHLKIKAEILTFDLGVPFQHGMEVTETLVLSNFSLCSSVILLPILYLHNVLPE